MGIRPNQKGFLHPQAGMNLIEVTISIALLSMMMVGIIAVYASGFSVERTTRDRSLIMSQMKKYMEETLAFSFDSINRMWIGLPDQPEVISFDRDHDGYDYDGDGVPDIEFELPGTDTDGDGNFGENEFASSTVFTRRVSWISADLLQVEVVGYRLNAPLEYLPEDRFPGSGYNAYKKDLFPVPTSALAELAMIQHFEDKVAYSLRIVRMVADR